jgi:hypothetical protein
VKGLTFRAAVPWQETFLHAFVALQEKVAALHRFSVINRAALAKILKKYVRWVAVPVAVGVLPRDPISPAASMFGSLPPRASATPADINPPELDLYDAELAAAFEEAPGPEGRPPTAPTTDNADPGPDTDMQALSASLVCGRPLAQSRLDKLQQAMAQLEDEVMVESSTCYDFMSSIRVQHWAKREQQKTEMREARALALRPTRIKRVASILNFQQTWHPAVLLILLLLTPIVTFGLSYTITASFVKNENGDSIFADQGPAATVEPSAAPYPCASGPLCTAAGYFLSASIDRSPASHIGTLGLSCTCFLINAVVLIRHKMIKRKLVGRATVAHRVSLFFGMASAFAALGVAAFQVGVGPLTPAGPPLALGCHLTRLPATEAPARAWP